MHRSIILMMLAFVLSQVSYAEEEFENFEIRVIRPKYFQKTNRFELGVQGIVITNQTFVYSFLGSGLLTFHLNEKVALEGFGSFGGSFDKQDKELLQNDYEIATQIVRTANTFGGGFLWTPIYGKFQQSDGDLVYFDTFISAFAGSVGVEYLFDHCKSDPLAAAKNPVTIQYPTFGVGVGQRFFKSKNSSLRWDIKEQMFLYDPADGACSDGVESASNLHHNILIQFGYTYFL